MTSNPDISRTMKSNVKLRSRIVKSQLLTTLSRSTLPPTGVSTNKAGYRILDSNPKVATNADAMNECDAPESINTSAHELNTRKVPLTTEGSEGVDEVVAA